MTFSFWNSARNVAYFRDKEADPRINKRLLAYLSEEGQVGSIQALDLGCGGGRHTKLLVDLGFLTSAVDLNPQMLQCTIDRVGKHNLSSIKKASIVKLPFKGAIFDVVITTGVLHQARNLSEYDQAIAELSRVTKPRGLVCLNIFTSHKLDSSYVKLSSAFAYMTKEGLEMTLLSKQCFYEMMEWHGFLLEEELSEDVVQENTGVRSVLRCNFIKSM